ncbi:MAG: CPBP family intramembrane glutamic endopeptidase [Pseudomonadota bacterium]
MKNPSNTHLALEYLLIFWLAPLVLAWGIAPIHPFPLLLTASALCLVALLKSKTFDQRAFFRVGDFRTGLRPVLLVFLPAALLLLAGTALFAPNILFAFPRRHPLLWLLVLLLYPFFSVYPQGLTHRAFIFHRYQPLFGQGWVMVLAAAAAFSFMHVVLKNPLALILTFIGGLLFGRTYLRTGSLVISGVEHALYGALLFTLGLGKYLYVTAPRL